MEQCDGLCEEMRRHREDAPGLDMRRDACFKPKFKIGRTKCDFSSTAGGIDKHTLEHRQCVMFRTYPGGKLKSPQQFFPLNFDVHRCVLILSKNLFIIRGVDRVERTRICLKYWW